jgi:hypothetical protein
MVIRAVLKVHNCGAQNIKELVSGIKPRFSKDLRKYRTA